MATDQDSRSYGDTESSEVFYILTRRPGLTAMQIARRAWLPVQVVERCLTRLERRGLIEQDRQALTYWLPTTREPR